MRGLALVGGSIALLVAWAGPLSHMANHAFFAHMTIHMLVVAVAAPLLALGVAGGRFDPVPYLPRVFAPIPASVAELLIVWAWHAPVPHQLARHYTWGLVAEQGSFLLAGLWVWLSAFGGAGRIAAWGDPAHDLDRNALVRDLVRVSEMQRRGAGVIGLLLTSMHMTLLGALLALSPRPLYGHHDGFGSMSPLADQHLGGAIMLVVGGIAYLAGGLALTGTLLKSRTEEQVGPT